MAKYSTITVRLKSVNKTIIPSTTQQVRQRGCSTSSGLMPSQLSDLHGKNGQLHFWCLCLSLYGQETLSKHPVSCAEEWERCQCHQTNRQAALRGRHQLCHSWSRERMHSVCVCVWDLLKDRYIVSGWYCPCNYIIDVRHVVLFRYAELPPWPQKHKDTDTRHFGLKLLKLEHFLSK